MQAIELDGLKKSERANCLISSRNTIGMVQRKAETGDVKPKPEQRDSTELKISNWESFGTLSGLGIKPKRKWHSYGMKLVSGQFRGHCGKLSILVKNLRVLPTG